MTEGVRVRAAAHLLRDQSDPDQKEYLYVYRIEIQNLGHETVQLLSRHWQIVDADGQSQDVVGRGVVGEQPVLSPGGEFEYVSSCPLRTTWGTMEGTYSFRRLGDSDGEFDVEVARFFLVPSAPPLAPHRART